jgi:L-alanine-DL-glutamate epimerase-like enolase superfamily enzyme
VKIKDIRTHIVGEQRNFLFVVVETDDGIVGVGEAGVTWREKAVAGFIDALRPALIDQDPMRTEHLWQLMLRSGFFPANRIGAAAISAIDIALWDIKARALDVPLYQLLGGQVRDRVVCYPHAVGASAAELAEHAVQLVSEGWQFIRFNFPERGDRLEPRQAIRDALEHVTAVRDAVGDEVELIIDVHTRLDPHDAVTFCRQVEPLNMYFVEDPVRSENPGVLARLRTQTGVPIAMGEQFATKWEFRQSIEQEWIDFCRVDLCIVGGLTEALKVAGWCETHYIPIAPHNPLGPVSTAACLHLDLATSNFAVQECARLPGQVLADLFPQQVPFENGFLLPPTGPGLGIEIDESAVASCPPLEGSSPRLSRNDGSYTNW